MPTTKHPWHRCYLHSNHKFIAPSPRTSRQAFGRQVTFEEGHPGAVAVPVILLVCAALLVFFNWGMS